MHVDRRMGKIGIVRADAIAEWVEDVPAALLDRDREFLFGTGLQLADLGLPMLGEIDEALRLLQRPQGQTPNGLAPHFLLASLVRNRERQIVAQKAEPSAPLRAWMRSINSGTPSTVAPIATPS